MRNAAVVLIALLLTVAEARASHRWGVQLESIRCGRNLVTVGDDAYFLLDRCGDPNFRNVVRLTRISDGLSASNGLATVSLEDSTYLLTEEWVYKQGRGRFTKILTVTGGVLTDIRVARRQ